MNELNQFSCVYFRCTDYQLLSLFNWFSICLWVWPQIQRIFCFLIRANEHNNNNKKNKLFFRKALCCLCDSSSSRRSRCECQRCTQSPICVIWIKWGSVRMCTSRESEHRLERDKIPSLPIEPSLWALGSKCINWGNSIALGWIVKSRWDIRCLGACPAHCHPV